MAIYESGRAQSTPYLHQAFLLLFSLRAGGLDAFFLDMKHSLFAAVIISLVLCSTLMKSCVG